MPTPATARAPHPLAWAGAWALVVFYIAAAPLAAARMGDFTHLWVGGAAWLEGAAYDPVTQRSLLEAAMGQAAWAARNDSLGAFFYPPTALLLYIPMGLLPLNAAATVMAVLNAALGVLGGWLLSRLTRLSLPAAVAVVLLFPGFFFAYALGQNAPLTLCLCLGAVLASRRGRPLLAGLLLGALVFKPSWLMAVAWLPILLPRGRRVLLGMLASAAGLSLLSLPTGAWPAFLELAPRIATLPEQGGYPLHLQFDIQALGLRVGLDWLGWLAAAAVVGISCWRGRGRLAAALLAATIVNPHLHHYDALPALLGAAVLAAGTAGSKAPARRWLWLFPAFYLCSISSELDMVGRSFPLPTFAMLALWGLALRWEPGDAAGGA
jgi:hypothetical protein